MFLAGSEIPLVQSIYRKAYKQIERFSRFFLVFVVHFETFFYVILPFLIALYKYIVSGFTNHLSGSLAYPAWYVQMVLIFNLILE